MSSATLLTGPCLSQAKQSFLAELPRIAAVIRYHTRRWRESDRQDLRDEMLSAAWHGLARRGKDPVAVGPTGIARNAVRYVRGGRRLGTGRGGPGLDLFDRDAQRRLGVRPVRLDGDDPGPSSAAGWRGWLACDRRSTPAEQACFRLDFDAWLASLPERKRGVAGLLAVGWTTGEVARALGVTPGAVSQTRSWLAASWRLFRGEPASPVERTARLGDRPVKRELA